MTDSEKRAQELLSTKTYTPPKQTSQQETATKPKPVSYFKNSELMCHCGCNEMPQQAIIDKLNEIREAYGKPITLTSVKRCAAHNKAIGGAAKSAHVEGIAADLARTPELLVFILKNAEKFNIWIEDPAKTPTWIHIDLRPRDVGPTRIFKV